MRRPLALLPLALASLCCGLTADPDPLAAKKQEWQAVLERDPFRFSEADASVQSALSQYRGNCQVHMIFDPAKWWNLTFKFVRDGKEILSFEGHKRTVFRTVKNVLYVAHFPSGSFGCSVAAYDLDDGKKLWETQLSAVGRPPHSAYGNEVTMGICGSGGELDAVSITGREDAGDYVEILDQKTGQVLAHKVYRKGFGK